MFTLNFGREAAEVIFFYVYERINPDGTINSMVDQNNEVVHINSPSDLWYLVNHIKNKTKKVIKK
jgi:Golgi nucleoside diphosphatase